MVLEKTEKWKDRNKFYFFWEQVFVLGVITHKVTTAGVIAFQGSGVLKIGSRGTSC